MAFRYSALLLAPLFGIFALGVACEDQFVPFGERDAGSPPSSNGGGNAAGGNGPTSPPVGGGTTISPTGGAAGSMSTSGFGGAGGGSVCAAAGGTFAMEIDRFDNQKYGCAINLANSGFQINGTVEESTPDSITVDECPPPEQPCDPAQTTTVTWSAADLVAPMVPIGNFVTIEFAVAVTQGGCVQRLQITDLPTWFMMNNPGGLDDTLWLAAADGTTDTFVDSPFFMTPIAIGDCGPAGIDAFALDFALTSDPGTMTEVYQGQLAMWPVDMPPTTTAWQIRNLRSYETGNPNATTNWAYWLTPAVIQN